MSEQQTFEYTGCPKSPVPIRFSIFSTIVFDRINFFFLKDRPIHKVFFHKNMVYKYSFELSVFTKIQNFDLYRNGVNSFQKRFLIQFCLLMWLFDRENCFLSICARPRSLARSIEELYAFSREHSKSAKWPWTTLNWVQIGVIGHAESSGNVYF